jgi:hypothetical protein
VRGVINLMYFRYEKFKKWMRLSCPAGGLVRNGVGRGRVVAAVC